MMQVMPIPERTAEQRAAALHKAHEARSARAAIRAGMRAGEIDPLVVLDEWQRDETWAALPARIWLLSLPGVGEATADKVMAQAGVSRTRRLRGLGQHQREALRAFALGRRT